MANFKKLLSNIDTFIFDVDGVMTDGIVMLSPSGEMFRTMNVKDGYALQLAVKKGYNIFIISGGYSESIKKRFEKLGINRIYLGVSNKLDVYHKILEESDISSERVLYMGDDIPDCKVMKEVGLPACPADAAEEIKAISIYISSADGGKGCVRDMIEQVMKVHDKWFDDDGFHW